jgi:hypothetical protein
MTGRLKAGKIYSVPICYKCPGPELRHGKTISPNDKNAHKLKDGSWICGEENENDKYRVDS